MQPHLFIIPVTRLSERVDSVWYEEAVIETPLPGSLDHVVDPEARNPRPHQVVRRSPHLSQDEGDI